MSSNYNVGEKIVRGVPLIFPDFILSLKDERFAYGASPTVQADFEFEITGSGEKQTSLCTLDMDNTSMGMSSFEIGGVKYYFEIRKVSREEKAEYQINVRKFKEV
jgi:hypothetical protein